MNGIYIHIPFCRSKCIYCDFYSLPQLKQASAIVDGIIAEYNKRRGELDSPAETLYIGGGTPSAIPAEMLGNIVNQIDTSRVKEFTIEVNPDDVNEQTVESWLRIGVNRISMGVQSLDDNILRRLGRRHNARQAINAITTIRNSGITNVNCDLIYGIPGMSHATWRSSLETLMECGLSHLSAYCLTYHEGTFLHKLLTTGKIKAADDDDIAEQYEALCKTASLKGMEHYEISNFAMPGHRSCHNSLYWSPEGRWLGLGPSAHSYDGRIRRIDIPDTHTWLDRLPSPFTIDEEDDNDRINDIIVTSLRTLEGLDLNSLPGETAVSVSRNAARFVAAGAMTMSGSHLAIRPAYWLISDSFIREVIV